MATIIDALLVEIGLDASKFQKGQRDATDAFTKTKEAAAKSGKGIEDASEKAAQSLAKLARQVLELYAVFLGGRGVAQFVSDITAGDAALGRFSASIGESHQVVAAWGLLAERAGGSSAATSAAFGSLSDKLVELRTQGKAMPMAFYQLQAAGGRTIEINKGVGQSFIDIAANLKSVAATDPATANFFARQLGIDPETTSQMIRYGAQVGAEIEKLKKLGPSEKDKRAAQELQEAWVDLTQEAEHFGRALFNSLSPALIEAMKRFDAFIEKKENQEKFNAVIKQFSDWIAGIDWNKAENGVKDFAKAADDAAKAVGGWKTVGEALFGVWAVSKISGIVTGVWGLVTAIRAATAAGAALMLNPIVAALAVGALGIKGIDSIPSKNRASMRRGDGTAQAPATEHQPMRNRAGATPSSGGGWGAISGAFNKLFGVTGAKAEGVQMEGRPVDRGNPLAVMVTNAGGGQFFGQGINGSSGGDRSSASGGGSTGPGRGGGGTPASGDGQGHLASGAEREAFIRAEAIKRGIDPDVAMKVARSEGFGKFTGDYGTSHGDFQLHQAGNIPGMRSRGLGDDFKRDTGLDPADPKNWKQADQYALNKMVEQGLTPWHGWKGPARAGLGGAHQAKIDMTPWSPAAKTAARVPKVTPSPSVTNNSSTRATTSTSTSETHIGSIHVTTQATDAAGIARELPKAIERSSFASQANAGPE